MLRELAYGIGALVVLAYAVDFFFSLQDAPNEPPRLRPKLPLIGHLVGLLQYGSVYYSMTSKRSDAEIYTLGIFHFKLYISNTRRLTPVIQKAKTLSFRPAIQLSSKIMGDANNFTHALFGTTFVDEFSHTMKNALLPGPQLDEQNLRMGDRLIVDVDELLDGAAGQGKRFMLQKWVRHTVVQASSHGVYGKQHPFVNPEIEEAFWTWQEYLPMHIAGMQRFARQGLVARETIFTAYRAYFAAIPEDASWVTRERVRVQREAGVTMDEIAKQDATFPIAVFANTVPTLYWTIWELFSRPAVLAEVRAEVEAAAVSGSRAAGFVLDVGAVKTQCPLLLSVLEETQRMRHSNAVFRKVMADTLLDGRYLLKGGQFLQMPGNPIHTNPSVWGPTAAEFDPYRFVPKTGADGRHAVPASGFLAWGSPPHLCPARQFASAEMLIAVAMLAMRAELRPSSGAWEKNPALHHGDLVTVLGPKKDVEMDVRVRDQWAGEWQLKMGGGQSRVSLASG